MRLPLGPPCLECEGRGVVDAAQEDHEVEGLCQACEGSGASGGVMETKVELPMTLRSGDRLVVNVDSELVFRWCAPECKGQDNERET